GPDLDQCRQQDGEGPRDDDERLGATRREHDRLGRHAGLDHPRRRRRPHAAPERVLLALPRPLPVGPRLPRLLRSSRPHARDRDEAPPALLTDAWRPPPPPPLDLLAGRCARGWRPKPRPARALRGIS